MCGNLLFNSVKVKICSTCIPLLAKGYLRRPRSNLYQNCFIQWVCTHTDQKEKLLRKHSSCPYSCSQCASQGCGHKHTNIYACGPSRHFGSVLPRYIQSDMCAVRTTDTHNDSFVYSLSPMCTRLSLSIRPHIFHFRAMPTFYSS